MSMEYALAREAPQPQSMALFMNEWNEQMHDHNHHHHEELSDGRLLWTVALNVALTIVEIVAGVISGSLALIADAVHNLGDAGALVVAWVARRVSRKGADGRFSFGYQRAELIGAFLNLTALLAVSFFLAFEAVERFRQPETIETTWVFVAAGAALIVDLATVVVLWSMARGSMNVRAAFLHNLSDGAASLFVILGAVAIELWGWLWIDPLLTLLLALWIAYSALRMLRRTVAILMQAVPPDLVLAEVCAALESASGVLRVHHVHVWELDEHRRAAEAHVVVAEDWRVRELDPIRRALHEMLRERFDITHACLEFEHRDGFCADHEDVCR